MAFSLSLIASYGAFLNCSYIQIRTEPCSYAEKWLHEENLKPTDQIERPLEEWKKFFHFSMRIQGARIMKIKVDTDAIYIPERFENVDVALIAQDAFKKEMAVLCSKRLFTKLPKETKVHTAAAYLQGNYQFTEEQKTYLTDYASKNREAIIEKCIQQDDAQALSRCLSLGKKSNAMWEAAFAKARETKGKPTAIVMTTTKGKGVSFMENNAGWHGKATNAAEYEIAMAELKAALAELEA